MPGPDTATLSSAGVSPLGDSSAGPVIVTPHAAGVDAAAWATAHRARIEDLLGRHKAVLFRGFDVDSVQRFQALLAALGADLLEYSERSTPRSTVGGRIYTSTEYPRTDEIPMHNENSYSLKWPRRVLFCCIQPAGEGGATPIADSRTVHDHLEARVRQTFLDKQVMYVRNYGQGVDLTWQDAFQTESRASVESYCRSAGISYEWLDDGACLRTRQVRPAAFCYRPTGERVWFNQAHLFHVSSLDPGLRQALCEIFPADRLPRHACYGDGTPIGDDVIGHIRDVYAGARVPIEWQQGDVLLLDNLFYAHGRLPYTGERKVIVAMDGLGGADMSPL
jgi:alpha-ketoglutarate-dependent taurine dioxygenase